MKEIVSGDSFFALLKIGLWQFPAELSNDKYVPSIEWDILTRLAEEQAVVGLVAAGQEKMGPDEVPKTVRRGFVKRVLALESKNLQMNEVVSDIMTTFSKAGITACLVKGQGIAQCYERPLWRSAGDIDLMVSFADYEKAKDVLEQWSGQVGKEGAGKHFEVHPEPYEVEVHGSFYTGLSPSLDARLDVLKEEAFAKRAFCPWSVDERVLLLSPDYDVIYVFSHILHHFFLGGIGLRQICDWTRLLWTYRDEIDHSFLEQRLNYLGLLSEWKAFGAFAVNYLGMPASAMPFYDERHPYRKKTRLLLNFIMEVGNFGHNRDYSFYQKYPYLIRKAKALSRKGGDFVRHARIFPRDSIVFLLHFLKRGTRAVVEGR